MKKLCIYDHLLLATWCMSLCFVHECTLYGMKDHDGCEISITQRMLKAISKNENDKQDLLAALDQGANIRVVIEHDQAANYSTPVTFAMYVGRFQFAQLIVDRFPNVNELQRDGHTFLTATTLYAGGWYALFSHPDYGSTFQLQKSELLAFFQYLLSRGAEVNLPNEMGKTALHIAVERHLDEQTKLLLEHGADIYARDKNGVSVLDIANRPLSVTCKEKVSPFCVAQQLVQRKHRELLQNITDLRKEVAQLEQQFFDK